jgi:hypothetical protein
VSKGDITDSIKLLKELSVSIDYGLMFGLLRAMEFKGLTNKGDPSFC